MEDNDFYRYNGKQWFSATDTPAKLKIWFSEQDIIEMLDLGYMIYEFEIESCRVVSEHEICFTRDSIINQKVIDYKEIYVDHNSYKPIIDETYDYKISKKPLEDKIIITSSDTPWEIACMFINAEHKIKDIFNQDMTERLFKISDLRRIGEHLINYCNTEEF